MSHLVLRDVWRSGSSVVRTPLALLSAKPFGMVYLFYIEDILSDHGLGLGRMSQLAVYCVWRSGSSAVITPLALLSAKPFGIVYFFMLELSTQIRAYFLSFLNKFSFYTKFGYNGYNLVLMMNDN